MFSRSRESKRQKRLIGGRAKARAEKIDVMEMYNLFAPGWRPVSGSDLATSSVTIQALDILLVSSY